jgi:hypothetical protein
VVGELEKAGVPNADAEEFAEVLSSEKPETGGSPFGKRAREWLSKNIPKAINGTWKIGVGIASKVFEEAALRYYGLK